MFRKIYYCYCNLWNKLEFYRKHAEISKDVKIFGRVRLCGGDGLLKIKKNVRIVSDWRANPIGGEYTVFNLVWGGNNHRRKFRIIQYAYYGKGIGNDRQGC
ncbi:hypothetical protein H8Z79_08090 [Blautia sp. 2744]|uniref:Uncharacterized protein n=1 Tax=Blautia intestinalis TaxID=2763028 RepID=A0ABR7I1P9_9FIRM|nr:MULTISPECIES: hypothetical protein [Blautia]MBC5740423.1 hypothetical protein [Blautia intestinalis]